MGTNRLPFDLEDPDKEVGPVRPKRPSGRKTRASKPQSAPPPNLFSKDVPPMDKARTYDQLNREELIRLLTERDAAEAGGIRLSYSGQAPPWHIVRRVQPRRQKIEKKHCVGGRTTKSRT